MTTTQTNASASQKKTATPPPAGLGKPNTKRETRTADPFEQNPAFVPGKPGFEKGAVLAGLYVGTTVARSNKFRTNLKDAQGRKCRLVHTLRTDDAKAQAFDIWSVGKLNVTLPRLKAGQYVEVTYLGLGDKALREGESPSHEFAFKIEGEWGPQVSVQSLIDGRSVDVSDDVADSASE